MIEPLTLAFRAMSRAELHDLRLLARGRPGFVELARQAVRLGYVAAGAGGSLDPEASLGLSIARSTSLMALALEPADSDYRERIKRAVFASQLDLAPDGSNLEAILAAAAGADRVRLASATAARRRDRER